MYRLLGRLESGGLAEWFRAERLGEPTEGPRPVIVKLLHAKTSDTDYARSAAETARRLSAVTVAGLPRVLEVGTVRGRVAIVREDFGRYTLGQVLRRLLTREVHLPATLALALIVDLLDVLAQAHAAGLVHGALTPANVLVAADGSPGVVEFGALEALEASPALRRVFAARGRSAYRAPELQGSERATVASDVYAVGAMAYELLTLREASLGPTSVSTRQARLPPPSRLVRRLNARIDAVIMRSLEASPSRRFRSCADLSGALRDALLQEGGVPSRAELERFVAELFPNEVSVAALEPAPFTEAFSLSPIAGAELHAEALDDVQVAARNPFSGGEVTDRTETIDGMPALGGATAPELEPVGPARPPPQEVTAPSVPAVPPPGASAHRGPVPATDTTDPSLPVVPAPPKPATWDAPAAAVVETAPARAADDQALRRRMKAVEDFKVEVRPGAETLRDPPPEPPPAKPPPTLVNFVTPFQRTDVPMPPSHEERKAKAMSNARVAAAGSTLVLMLFVILAAWRWYMVSTDMAGDLIQYLPGPVRAVFGNRAPRPGPPPGMPPPGPTVKLPDYDKLHPSKSPNPYTDPLKPLPEVPPKPVSAPTPAPAAANCHGVPAGAQVGYLAVGAPRGSSVLVDGRPVCGALGKIAVAAGDHEIRVNAPRGRQQAVYSQRVEAGRTVKLVPVFK